MFCSSNRLNIDSHVPCPWALAGNVLPFLNLMFHDISSALYDEGNFCQNEDVSSSSRFCICFCSLLINTRLVFISYFVSVPLRKGYRGFEYRFCLFVCTCFFLHFWLFVLKLLVFIDCFVLKLLVSVDCFVRYVRI